MPFSNNKARNYINLKNNFNSYNSVLPINNIEETPIVANKEQIFCLINSVINNQIIINNSSSYHILKYNITNINSIVIDNNIYENICDKIITLVNNSTQYSIINDYRNPNIDENTYNNIITSEVFNLSSQSITWLTSTTIQFKSILDNKNNLKWLFLSVSSPPIANLINYVPNVILPDYLLGGTGAVAAAPVPGGTNGNVIGGTTSNIAGITSILVVPAIGNNIAIWLGFQGINFPSNVSSFLFILGYVALTGTPVSYYIVNGNNESLINGITKWQSFGSFTKIRAKFFVTVLNSFQIPSVNSIPFVSNNNGAPVSTTWTCFVDSVTSSGFILAVDYKPQANI